MTEPEQVLRSAKERETVNGAVRALRSAAPAGWERLDFEFRATVGIDSASLEVEGPDGERRTAMPPGQAVGKMDELRRVMYRDGQGAWFTARLQVERSGRFSAEFDYDGEPDFTPPLTSSAYAVDLDRYPRSDEHIPGWLREKLSDA
ncbi:antitoxin YezG family protein [Spirillospora sp. NBC_00431]